MKCNLLLVIGLIALAAGTFQSNGAVTITAIETGGDVMFMGSGMINLGSLSFSRSIDSYAGLTPKNQSFPPGVTLGGTGTGTDPLLMNRYLGISTTPSILGSGAFRIFDLVSGDRFGVGNRIVGAEISVPDGYISGSMLQGTGTFIGETFATLGVVPGTYVWEWGSGNSADSLTLNVLIPEPSTGMLVIFGLSTMFLRRHRRSPV